MAIELDQVDVERIRQIILQWYPGFCEPDLEQCVQSIIDYAGTHPRIRAGSRALIDRAGESPEMIVARILADVGAFDAQDFDAWASEGPPPGGIVEAEMPASARVQERPWPDGSAVGVSQALIDAVCRMLVACESICARTVRDAPLTRPEKADIRKQRKRLVALSAELQHYATAMWPFDQQTQK